MTEATPTNSQAALYKALSLALRDVRRVEKDGFNPHFKYAYTTEAGLLDAVRPIFAEHGLSIVVSQDEPHKLDDGKTTRVKLNFTVLHADGGSFGPLVAYGEAQDTTDKGLYKAITGACKYFWFKTLMVSTGDDPEVDGDAAPTRRTNGSAKPATAAAPAATSGGTSAGALRAKIHHYAAGSSEHRAHVVAAKKAIGLEKPVDEMDVPELARVCAALEIEVSA